MDEHVRSADHCKLAPRRFRGFLRNIVLNGGGDPFDLPLSKSTVHRHMNKTRLVASHLIDTQQFPRKVVIHFDGVRVQLGAFQGNEKKEHICLTSTGIGGERKIAIMVAADGSGEVRFAFAYLICLFLALIKNAIFFRSRDCALHQTEVD